MATRLVTIMESENWLSDRQYGFRQGEFTENDIGEVLNRVKRSECKYVIWIFLDFSGAFDHAWWPAIINELRKKGCPQNLLRIYKSYLSDRLAIINYRGIILSKELNMECPQGSVIGPILWNILFNGFLQVELNPSW